MGETNYNCNSEIGKMTDLPREKNYFEHRAESSACTLFAKFIIASTSQRFQPCGGPRFSLMRL
eukprot:1567295-Amphidinium_carterae.1